MEAIENGFSPLECCVDIVGQRLGFGVFDVWQCSAAIVELACPLGGQARWPAVQDKRAATARRRGRLPVKGLGVVQALARLLALERLLL